MPYRLLLPATLDLVPADVDSALQPFGAHSLSDRGCAWALPEGGSPGVPADVGKVFIRLLPAKALATHPDEPRFSIPKGTQRAVEVITPADNPRPADCRRVHDCATALAQTLELGVLNPYRGVYSASAASYCDGLTDPPETDAIRVRCRSENTERDSENRTRPGKISVVRSPAPAQPVPVADDTPGPLRRLLMHLRGLKRHRLPLPGTCTKKDAQALLRQIRAAVPVACVSFDRRGRAIVIDAPDTVLVSRTVADLVRRYSPGTAPALEVSPAGS